MELFPGIMCSWKVVCGRRRKPRAVSRRTVAMADVWIWVYVLDDGKEKMG